MSSYRSTVSWLIVSIIFLTGFFSAVQNVNADSLQVYFEPACGRQDGSVYAPPCQAGMTVSVFFYVFVKYGGNPLTDAKVFVSVTTPDGAIIAATSVACAAPNPEHNYCFRYTLSPSARPGVYTVNVRAEPPQFCAGACPDPGTAQATFTVVPATTTTAGLQTDWVITSVSLSPSSPHVGDQVAFSMVMTAQSSTGSFPQSVEVGCMIDSTVCGTGTLSYPGPTGVPFTVTSETPWTATPGTHTLSWGVRTIPAGLDPNPSNNIMSTQFTVAPQAQFDFSLSVSPSQQSVAPGGSTSYTVTVSLVSGAAQSVALSLSGAPSGVSGSFNPTSGTPTFSSTLSVTAASSASSGTVTMTITGGGGGATHTATVTLTVSQAADFRIDVSPPSQAALQGQTVSYAVNVAGLNGFNSQVSLAVSGYPSGADGVFSAPSGTPDFASTLTVTVPSSSPTGSFTLTITGSGGGISRVANVVLAINPSQPQSQTTQTATTQTTPTTPGELLDMLQQNSLLIIAALAVLVILFAAISMRGRGRRAVPQQMAPSRTFCGKCGAENPASNEFCVSCGNKLKGS